MRHVPKAERLSEGVLYLLCKEEQEAVDISS
jgi:hypothetical protein